MVHDKLLAICSQLSIKTIDDSSTCRPSPIHDMYIPLRQKHNRVQLPKNKHYISHSLYPTVFIRIITATVYLQGSRIAIATEILGMYAQPQRTQRGMQYSVAQNICLPGSSSLMLSIRTPWQHEPPTVTLSCCPHGAPHYPLPLPLSTNFGELWCCVPLQALVIPLYSRIPHT